MAVYGKIGLDYMLYKKLFFFFWLIIISLILSVCALDKNIDIQNEFSVSERKWTFIIYMAADNDLEYAAIANFKELEAVNYGNTPISILVLLDRSPYYDMTNGNWSGTRLYEIKTDIYNTALINSTRLNCPELGLTKDTDVNLNTADPLVLSKLIDFSKRVYPAENYALIIWGHGTGWRSNADSFNSKSPLKAIAFDDTHGQYMSLPAFGRAIENKGLSVIGFDTCYGAVLEVAYQIRNNAEILIGSEGAILSSGWNYTSLFNDFINKPELSIINLSASIIKQFSERYSSLSNATISQIRLSQIENLFIKFNNFTGNIANSIVTQTSRNIVLNEILNNVESHYFTSFPSDLYIDVFDFCQKINAIRANITANDNEKNAINNAAVELDNALSAAIPSSWAQNGTTKKIGVHVIPLQGINVPASSHELAYIKNSMAIDKSAFVTNSLHWVPNAVPQPNSLLDKLFYFIF